MSEERSVSPTFGLILHSDYFKSRIVVVRYEADDRWWFVVESRPHEILRARTRLSEMAEASARLAEAEGEGSA